MASTLCRARNKALPASLVATPGKSNSKALDFVLMPMGSAKPITKYDIELTKQLHVIAVSDDFKTFLHDHVTQAAKDGHLRLSMTFPHPGLYHVYADSTPTGLGQQVQVRSSGRHDRSDPADSQPCSNRP